jgi:hypothetical protein
MSNQGSPLERSYVIISLKDWNDLPRAARWFYREHGPDVLQMSPWLFQYDSYRAVNPPPEGAEKYCFMNYCVDEGLMLSPSAERMALNGLSSLRAEPCGATAALLNVEAFPDDFYGAQRRPYETTVIRWMTAYAYPRGVSEEDGEDWFLNVHVPEVIENAKGLIRFFSYKAIRGGPNPANQHIGNSVNQNNEHLQFNNQNTTSLVGFSRLSEMWFETGRDWTKAFVTNLPKFTKPKWATQDEYPFVIPGKEFCSTFLLERPTDVLATNAPKVYYA